MVRLLGLSLGLWLSGALAQPATAVSAEDDPVAQTPSVYDSVPLPRPAEPEAERSPRLRIKEEVIVSATKRKADVRDIPLSIDTFSGEELRRIGATDIESIARFSPGVSTSPGFAPETAQVIIRGVASDTFINFFTRTFGIFYEDVSLINPSVIGPQPNLNPFDMKVEILKGPQGTLFGGSALAGAVRYVPNRPDYETVDVKLAAGVGTLSRSDGLSRRYDGLLNQPLAKNLALRVVASHNEAPGYIEDLRAGRDDINSSRSTQLRGLLSWRASEDLEFRLHALHRDTLQNDGPLADNDERPEHSKRFYPDFAESTSTNWQLTAEWNLDTANLVFVLSQLDKEYPARADVSTFLGTSVVGIGAFAGAISESSQPSAELRLVSTLTTESRSWLLRDWDYVAGVFYQSSDQRLGADLGTGLTGEILNGDGGVDATEYAGFFDLTRHLGDAWELGLGGRVFRQSTEADISYAVIAVDGLIDTFAPLRVIEPLIDALPVLGNIPFGRDRGQIAETGFSPKLTLLWRYSESLSLFGSAVKGFRYAGANQNLTRDRNIPLFFESDDIWNYEFGVRTRWLGGAMQVNATVFQLDWSDFQIQQRDYTGVFSYLTNVGGARNRGVELSVDTLLPAGFALRLTGSYVEAKTTTFFADFQGPAPAGSELPGSPPFSGSALLLWARPAPLVEFAGTLSWTYQNGNYNNLPHDYQHPPLGLLGAGASLRLHKVRGQPRLSLLGTNLTNEFKPGVVFETAKSGGILAVFNPPRAIMLGVEFSFGGND